MGRYIDEILQPEEKVLFSTNAHWIFFLPAIAGWVVAIVFVVVSYQVPAGAPAQIVSRLNREIARAADKPALKDIFQKQGAVAVTSSPADHSRRVNDEIKTWKDIIARAGVKLE